MRSRRIALIAAVAGLAVLLSGCVGSTAASTTASAAPTHPVTHARGTTEVSAAPQRVVTLEPLETDTAVAVGIVPVGAAVANMVKGVPSYLGVDAVTPVGTVSEPDLEAIAAVKPDLILGTESRHSALYDQLSAIAPTVFIATQADPWRDNAALIGEALGRRSEVQKAVDAVDTRCAEIAGSHGLTGKTAQMIRPRDETTLSLYGPVSFAGSLLQCVGYTIPAQEWADGLQADISPENAASATADAVFVTTGDVTDRSTIPPAITQNPAAFPIVTLVDASTWVAGVGPKGAQSVLDDIEAFLSSGK